MAHKKSKKHTVSEKRTPMHSGKHGIKHKNKPSEKLIRARAMGSISGVTFARPLDGGNDFYLDMPDCVAIDGDEILVRRTSQRGERPRAVLEKIENRALNQFVASLEFRPHGKRQEKRPFARPLNPRLPATIFIDGDLGDARSGDVLVLSVAKWPKNASPMTAKLECVLGSERDPSTLLLAAAHTYDLAMEFPDEVLDFAEHVSAKLKPVITTGRRDLRDRRVFTIDGKNAQDFDDAISLQKKGEQWELGVHIADVSHYVPANSPLDKEAFARGTSVYLPGLTLPMLPEALCNGICSLKPDEDRMAMTVLLRIDGDRVVSYKIFPSLIRSRARLTYEDVNALFAEKPNTVPKALVKTLLRMRELSFRLIEARKARESIELDTAESRIVQDETLEPVDIYAHKSGDAEKLIESFMLLANEAVASYARAKKLPFPYRVHEPSTPDDIATLNLQMDRFGYPPRANASTHALNGLLALAEGKSEEPLIKYAVMRALSCAHYSEQPLGHFALALTDYCHFTSPIRRYPDLLAHRLLKLSLLDELKDSVRDRYKKSMPEWTLEASRLEQTAAEAERRAVSMLSSLYLSRRTGEPFEGIVSRVTTHGARIILDNTIEGFLPVEQLEGNWIFLPEKMLLVSDYMNQKIRPGQRIRVVVAAAHPLSGEIEFKCPRGYILR